MFSCEDVISRKLTVPVPPATLQASSPAQSAQTRICPRDLGLPCVSRTSHLILYPTPLITNFRYYLFLLVTYPCSWENSEYRHMPVRLLVPAQSCLQARLGPSHTRLRLLGFAARRAVSSARTRRFRWRGCRRLGRWWGCPFCLVTSSFAFETL
jgi:hypothetical protein